MKEKKITKNTVTVAMIAVMYAVVSTMVYSGTAPRQLSSMLIPISCYVVMAVSLNFVVGFLGELSLGHAGFVSVGLFTGCLVSIATQQMFPSPLRMVFSMIIGGLAAAAVGFLVGLPALRLQGDYLAIVTLGCGEIIKNVITNLDITGGALGLNTTSVYSDPATLLPYAVVLVFVTVLVMMNLKKSRQGRAVMAIRDNRIAAESCGIDITRYKLMVFVLAAFFAGMAGTLYGHSFANMKAATFDYNMSIEILLIVVLGGMGSVRGSVIAAIILKALPEVLRDFADYRMLVYSILLIFIMIFNASPKFAGVREKCSVKYVWRKIREKTQKKAGCTPS